MSVSSVTSSSHRVGILMSGADRFVVCLDCRLRLVFPFGAHYDTIAKRFESHSCSVPLPVLVDVRVESDPLQADE